MTQVSYWLLASLSFVLAVTVLADDRVPTTDDVQEAIRDGLAEVESMLELERVLRDEGLTVTARHGTLRLSGSSKRVDAARILAASTHLKSKMNWSAGEARRSLPLLSLRKTELENSCPVPITCSPESIKYRPIDGSCHNRVRPDWGKADTPFARAMPNAYNDGIFQPRKAADGQQLKSARFVSTNFVKPPATEAADFTLVLMSWGQFITHDITKASAFTSADGKSPQCCDATSGQPLDPERLHPFCLPIDIPADDYFYSRHGQQCMTFVRTQIGADYSCTMGHAEQLNSNTHWLDGSMVYGSSQEQLDSLRLGKDGLLKSSTTTDGHEMLPLNPDGCSDTTCYYAGDGRAQENPQLAVLHTLMMREHNRIARALKSLNPLWSDETLLQEARRVVIAEIQHVTYTEYLPAMLGDQSMKDYKLNPSAASSGGARYDDETAGDPSIWNEFAAAAFRVGHSQVQGTLTLYDANDEQVADQSFTLSSYFFDASRLADPGFIDNAIRGLTKQMPLAINPEYTSQITNFLFKGTNPYGMDLVALNIQRGREHGIPDYNSVRVYCGLPKANTFDELSNEMNNDTIVSLKSAYASVNDIDLYIGCLGESSLPVKGSLLGPTGLCVVAEQFAVTKNNDRFFYDVANQSNSFTTAQLDEIRKTSLARIMCDNNNGNVSAMQPKAFRSADATSNNAKVPCASIPSMNLSHWYDPAATASPPSTTTTSKPNNANVVTPSILLLLLVLYAHLLLLEPLDK